MPNIILCQTLMIERIQSLSGKDGWKKPWFTEGALRWPEKATDGFAGRKTV